MKQIIWFFLLSVILISIGCQEYTSVSTSRTLPNEDDGDVLNMVFSLSSLDWDRKVRIDVEVYEGDAVEVHVVKEKDVIGKVTPKELRLWKYPKLGNQSFEMGKPGTMTVKIPSDTQFSIYITQVESAKGKSKFYVKVRNK